MSFIQIIFISTLISMNAFAGASDLCVQNGKLTKTFKDKIARLQRRNGCNAAHAIQTCQVQIGLGALAAAGAATGVAKSVWVRNTSMKICRVSSIDGLPRRPGLEFLDSAVVALLRPELVYATECGLRTPQLWRSHVRLMESSIRDYERNLQTGEEYISELEDQIDNGRASRISAAERFAEQQRELFIEADKKYREQAPKLTADDPRRKALVDEAMKRKENAREARLKLTELKSAPQTSLDGRKKAELDLKLKKARVALDTMKKKHQDLLKLVAQSKVPGIEFNLERLIDQTDEVARIGHIDPRLRNEFRSLTSLTEKAMTDAIGDVRSAQGLRLKQTMGMRAMRRGIRFSPKVKGGATVGGMLVSTVVSTIASSASAAVMPEQVAEEIDVFLNFGLTARGGCGEGRKPYETFDEKNCRSSFDFDARNEDFLYLGDKKYVELIGKQQTAGFCAYVNQAHAKYFEQWTTTCSNGFNQTIMEKPGTRLTFMGSGDLRTLASTKTLPEEYWTQALETQACCNPERGKVRPTNAECAMLGVKRVRDPRSLETPVSNPARAIN